MKALWNLVFVAVVAVGAYHYRDQLGKTAWLIKDRLFAPAPCTQPIKYSLGTFSDAFGVSRARFLQDVDAAISLWPEMKESPLFVYDPTGDSKTSLESGEVKLNLIYDYRQRATEKMQSLGLTIKDDVSSYDALKAKYDSLNAAYTAKKAQVESLSASFDKEKAAYEQQVAYWNSKGGAPKAEYERLQAAKAALNADAARVNQAIADANGLVDSINSAASVLNRLASVLNLNVKSYNSIGASTGAEFDEGQYVEDATGKHIDIYQFSDKGMLIRVLAHEFGHALGMDHVDDPKAIMYRLNQSTNEKPTAADLAELKRVCKISNS